MLPRGRGLTKVHIVVHLLSSQSLLERAPGRFAAEQKIGVSREFGSGTSSKHASHAFQHVISCCSQASCGPLVREILLKGSEAVTEAYASPKQQYVADALGIRGTPEVDLKYTRVGSLDLIEHDSLRKIRAKLYLPKVH